MTSRTVDHNPEQNAQARVWSAAGATRTALLCTALLRSVAFALLWWGLSGGSPGSWVIGAPAVALAVWASMQLLPPVGFSPLRFLCFLPGFFLRSLWAAMEVAWWAIIPGMPLSPAMVHYPLQLRSATSRVFFFNLISLQPGTLSVALDAAEQRLIVHVLNAERDPRPALARLERQVAGLFGELPA